MEATQEPHDHTAAEPGTPGAPAIEAQAQQGPSPATPQNQAAPVPDPETFDPDIPDLQTEAEINAHVVQQPLGSKIADPANYGGPGPQPAEHIPVADQADIDPTATEGVIGHLLEAYRSPLGLSGHDRAIARLRASYAAMVGVARRGVTEYTEGASRWDGIDNRRNPWGKPRQSPHHADCSAFYTWAVWIATRAWKLGDFVNGEGWRAGYTGTMTSHGERVDPNHLIHADAVFYGGSFSVPQHVAIYVGNGRVVSHGSPGEPKVYPTDLYGALPIMQCRRYIR